MQGPTSEVEGTALGALLERSHILQPDHVAIAARETAEMMGALDLCLYLVDYDQRVLTPVPDPDRRDPADVLEIDSTMAGRAYRQQQPIVAHGDRADEVKLWFPLLDGAERLGVMGVSLRDADDAAGGSLAHLASLVAELVVSKSMYGDTLEQVRRRRPMALGSELRWWLLPPLTFTTPRVSVSGILEPAYEVAGDAFDYAIDGDTLHLAVLDAMGHGLEAARLANLTLGAYRHARRQERPLREMYAAMDEVVREQFGEDRFVTAQLATLSLDSGRLRWLNAGHPRALLLRRETVVGELEGDTCLPIGLGDVPATVCEASLEPGDGVVFFSDGVVEARSPDGELFGERRLADHLSRAAASKEPPAEMMRRLAHAILAHEAADLHDDATLLLVRWYGGTAT